jgi:methylenetetrahydrofolate dehydrogenase (NADP+)/methenyltetrahydrofolate cyclohydrolase
MPYAWAIQSTQGARMPGQLDAHLMDGVALSRKILEGCERRAAAFAGLAGRRPCLAAVLVGRDPASITYVKMKQARCERIGVESVLVELPQTSTTREIVAAIEGLSANEGIDGILLQHPVPGAVDERAAFEAIVPHKDVDGVTMASFASMAFGLPGFASCTPAGIMRLLDAYEVDPTGRHAVVIGRSPILGKPIGMLLLARNATVTYCHSRTDDLPAIVRTADIVVAAVGRPHLVRGDWIKSGAVVIDAGYNQGNVGDVAFAEAVSVAGLITPVPGGVGPMTIALLIEQTISAAQEAQSARSGLNNEIKLW